MYGVLLAELEKFVGARYGKATWAALLDEAGLEPETFVPENRYPDAHLSAILRAVPAALPPPIAGLAEDFGAFVAPELLRRYAHLILPSWRTLEILNHAEAIYGGFADAIFGTAAPVLRGERTGKSEVTLTYASHRRLCALAKGLARGMAGHFGESVEVREPACMLQGADACSIVVRKL